MSDEAEVEVDAVEEEEVAADAAPEPVEVELSVLDALKFVSSNVQIGNALYLWLLLCIQY